MTVLRTHLCDRLGIEYPILLAGMGNASRATLVAAVSNAGGLGVLGANALPPDELRQEIRAIRSATDRPFGVDLVLPRDMPDEPPPAVLPDPLPDPFARAGAEMRDRGLEPGSVPARPSFTRATIEAQVAVLVDERIAVFVSGLGLADWVVPPLRSIGAQIVAMVGTVRGARRAVATGADVVVAQGTEAGGHTGRIGTLALVPQVVDAVGDVPVLAAGGIADGRGLVAALALGASGVVMGTRFLATPEAHIHDNYKAKLLDADEDATTVTRAYSGKTARHMRNRFTELWEGHEQDLLPMPAQRIAADLVIGPARQVGDMDFSSGAAGQVAGMIHQLRPAAEIVAEVVDQAHGLLTSGFADRVYVSPRS